MDALFQDLKFAVRQLLKDRGFLVTATVTLAVCIGANVTIFAVVNSVILQPLPVPEPERLVRMWNAYPNATGGEGRGSNAAPDYFDRRELTEVFQEVAAYQYRGRSLVLEGAAERVRAMAVTPSFFRLLRADARLGRTFLEKEEVVGNHRVAVLTHGLWQQVFGGDPSAVGEELRLDGETFEVVGVMPESFYFLDEEVRLYTPLAFTEEQKEQYHSNSWSMIARLRDGVTLEQAQARIDALNAANMEKNPELKPLLVDAGFHTPVVFLQEDLVREIRPTLYMLWGGVAFVLLIGCVNIANLVLVRTTNRKRELATRFAMGAQRRRVVQQLFTESVLLTLVGAVLGLLIGYGGLQGLQLLGLEQLPRDAEIGMDPIAIGFTAGLAGLVALLIALIPVGGVLRLKLSAVFREEGRSGTSGRGVRLLRRGMVVGQVALALILLVGAGLLLASFQQMLAVDIGFDADDVLTGIVVLPESRYEDGEAIRTFAHEALREIRALPGVTAAGITSQIPFGNSFSSSVIFAEGYEMKPGESVISPAQSVVTPGYFAAMDVPLIRGRLFRSTDTEESNRVAIVDQRLAQRFWPDQDAVGKRLWRPTSAEDFQNPENAEFFRVVGVVGQVRQQGLAERVDTLGGYYFPLGQETRRGLDFAIEAEIDPASLIGPVRQVIADLDPELPLFDIRTMNERIDESLADRRTPMILTLVFGAVALLLAAVGIYGIFAYSVALRTREIGIRIALGSDAARIFRLVLREGAAILAVGLALGIVGVLALRRLIESQLYGVGVMDPVVLAAVVGILGLVAMVACVIPARRATRIDPVEALSPQ